MYLRKKDLWLLPNTERSRGVTYGETNIFMGVEYGHAKRFMACEDLTPWEGIKDAYRHGNVAPQVLAPNTFSYHRGIHVLELQNEDCQNLNIWAPKTENGEKKPVFVFIHGGGFFGGNAFEEISFDGFNLSHHGDIIFVSINHRLNVLGYLNLEDYHDDLWNSGNAGLTDLVVAMKWIHENIEAFGGDPGNVTICGHSGGGGKVQCLYQLEEAAPYFKRGICLSGARGPIGSPSITREDSRATAKAIMDELGITKENIDKVFEVPFDDLARACAKAANPFLFSPVPNDYFPGFPAFTKIFPFSKDKPIIYGSVLGEFPFVSLSAEEKEAMSEDDKANYLRSLYEKNGDRIIELFRKSYPDHDIIDLAYLDYRCRIAVKNSAEKHLEAGCKEVYLFLGSYTAPEDGEVPIWHGGEVAYIFMNEDKVLVLNDEIYGQKYGKIFSTMVLNFVKYGNPNNKYLPKWEPTAPGKNRTMIIDKTCRVVENHDDELLDLYKDVAPSFNLKLKLNDE